MKKGLFFRAIATFLIITMVCSICACSTATPDPTETQASTISPFPIGMLLLSTKAAVKIAYNAVGLVTAVTGVNKEGQAVAANYTDFADKDCATAVRELIQLSADNGYLPESVKTVVLKQIPGSKVPSNSFLNDLTTQAQAVLNTAKAIMIPMEQLDERGYIGTESLKALLQSYLGVETLENCSGVDAPEDGIYTCTVVVDNVTHTYNIDADTGIIKPSNGQNNENPGNASTGEIPDSNPPVHTDSGNSETVSDSKNPDSNAPTDVEHTTVSFDLNVVSFNIRYINSGDTGVKSWDQRSGPLAKYLLGLNADIICMQEAASDKWYNFLKESLKESYAVYQGSNGQSGGVVTAIKLNAFTILEKELFWLSETPEHFSIGWDAKHPRVCYHFTLKHNATGIVFNVFNTHLDNYGVIAPVHSMELITKRIKQSKYPSILAGDMNEYETDETYKIATSVLQDTQKTAPITDSGRTFNSWGKNSDYSGTQVDFIFTSPSTIPLSFRICRERWNETNFYSDHYAVQSIIRISN